MVPEGLTSLPHDTQNINKYKSTKLLVCLLLRNCTAVQFKLFIFITLENTVSLRSEQWWIDKKPLFFPKQQPPACIMWLKWFTWSFSCMATHNTWVMPGEYFLQHTWGPEKCFAALVLIQSSAEITGKWLMLRGGYLMLIPAFKVHPVCHHFSLWWTCVSGCFCFRLSDVCCGLPSQLMGCNHLLSTWKNVIRQKSPQNQFHWRTDLSRRSKYMR